jgi:hypothetical protein
MELVFGDATVMTRLSICSPIFLLFTIADALKDFSANSERGGNSIPCHGARINPMRN